MPRASDDPIIQTLKLSTDFQNALEILGKKKRIEDELFQ